MRMSAMTAATSEAAAATPHGSRLDRRPVTVVAVRQSPAPARLRAQHERRRCLEGGGGDPSRGIGAGHARLIPVSPLAARSTPVRARGPRRGYRTGSLRQTAAGRRASRRARTRTPRCPSACRPPARAPAPDSCRRQSRRSRPAGCRRPTRWPLASCRAMHPRPQPSPDRSRELSRRRSGVILMLAGFRSRWTMPFSWAASSASVSCRAMASASASRSGPPRKALGERLALDQLEDQRAHAVGVFQSIDRADVPMVEGRQHTSLALEPRDPIRVAGQTAGQDLEGDVAAQLHVPRAVDLSHSAHANQGGDLVRTESGACRERQVESRTARILPQIAAGRRRHRCEPRSRVLVARCFNINKLQPARRLLCRAAHENTRTAARARLRSPGRRRAQEPDAKEGTTISSAQVSGIDIDRLSPGLRARHRRAGRHSAGLG